MAYQRPKKGLINFYSSESQEKDRSWEMVQIDAANDDYNVITKVIMKLINRLILLISQYRSGMSATRSGRLGLID
jgi:hypothetical protein